MASHLVLTLVHGRFAAGGGAAYFPEWENGGFVEDSREWWGADRENPFAMTILRMSRPRTGTSS